MAVQSRCYVSVTPDAGALLLTLSPVIYAVGTPMLLSFDFSLDLVLDFLAWWVLFCGVGFRGPHQQHQHPSANLQLSGVPQASRWTLASDQVRGLADAEANFGEGLVSASAEADVLAGGVVVPEAALEWTPPYSPIGQRRPALPVLTGTALRAITPRWCIRAALAASAQQSPYGGHAVGEWECGGRGSSGPAGARGDVHADLAGGQQLQQHGAAGACRAGRSGA